MRTQWLVEGCSRSLPLAPALVLWVISAGATRTPDPVDDVHIAADTCVALGCAAGTFCDCRAVTACCAHGEFCFVPDAFNEEWHCNPPSLTVEEIISRFNDGDNGLLLVHKTTAETLLPKLSGARRSNFTAVSASVIGKEFMRDRYLPGRVRANYQLLFRGKFGILLDPSRAVAHGAIASAVDLGSPDGVTESEAVAYIQSTGAAGGSEVMFDRESLPGVEIRKDFHQEMMSRHIRDDVWNEFYLAKVDQDAIVGLMIDTVLDEDKGEISEEETEVLKSWGLPVFNYVVSEGLQLRAEV